MVQEPSGERTTRVWDDQNRQTSVLSPGGAITTCTYRFDGLRASKEDSAGTTKHLWDFSNYLAETDEDNELQAVYTNEPEEYGNLISQYRRGPTIWVPSYYHCDALGSTRALTDQSGAATDTYLQDAWGNQVAVSGSTANPFRWVGQVGYYFDDLLATFYIRARVYDPTTGRWLSQDPLFYPAARQHALLGALTRRRVTTGIGITTSIWAEFGGRDRLACIHFAMLLRCEPLSRLTTDRPHGLAGRDLCRRL